MDPLFGLIGSIGSGLINNLFAGSRQSDAQSFAREQAAQAEANFRTNRQTAYQDTMMDMRNAGLNPILAYQRGATGSTMGATPGVSPAPVSDVGIGQGVSSAVAIRRQNQELQNMEATKNLTDAQTQKTLSEKRTEDMRPQNVEASTQQLQAQTGFTMTQLQTKLAEAMQSTSLADWIANNPKITQAAVVASFLGGAAGDAVKPFMEATRGLIGGATGNSAGSAARGNPVAPPGSSSRSNQNFDQKYGVPVDQMPSPNSYRRSSPGFSPAPPRPSRGWFSDRFYGVDQ
ncbi:MAG: hypothetical protein [Microviridae sp.]|nr:MAG: hypothetical protein [Microviridae sp.]